MSEELKLCDCGTGETDLTIWGDRKTGPFHVWCLNCDAEGPEKETEQEAVTAWNTRAGEKV